MESFQTAIYECPDVQATTMAMDANGRFVLMGGRKCMVLVDLDANSRLSTATASITNISSSSALTNPESTSSTATGLIETSTGTTSHLATQPSHSSGPNAITRLGRSCKYEPTSSHFNYTVAELYAISAYQTVEVYSIDDLNLTRPKLTLRGHSRAIADIEWSHYNPNMLGSAGADCLTNLWDIRDFRRPSVGLTSVSGATQVRFSKTSQHHVATCHEIDVRVWDIRQPNLPVHYIAAHLQKINGMDWRNPRCSSFGDHHQQQQQDQLVTCSQDNTIKLWDLCDNKFKSSANFSTKFPAWRIRYTPISTNAIVTSSLPQLRSRNECMSLKLWSMKPSRFESKRLELILNLVGHTDVIVDFDWRKRGHLSSSDCELVTWSKDRTLRVWRVDQQFIEMNVDNSDFEMEPESVAGHHQDHNQATEAEGDSPRPRDKTASTATNTTNPSAQQDTKFQRKTRSPKPKRGPQSPGSGHDNGNERDNDHEDDDQEDDEEEEEDDYDNRSRELMNEHHDAQEHRAGQARRAIGDEEHDGDDDDDGDDENHDDDDDDTTLYNERNNEAATTLSELKQEFNLINKNIPHIGFEELNALRRVCLVTAHVKNIGCRLRIALPPAYPRFECPNFTIIDSNQYGAESLDKESRAKLLRLLDETAKSQLDRGQNCIEPCLRRFVATLQSMSSYHQHSSISTSGSRRLPSKASLPAGATDTTSGGSNGAAGAGGSSSLIMADDPIKLSAQRDHSVPFPPTSGARFCGNLLVCFGRPIIPSMSSGVGGLGSSSGLNSAGSGPSPSPACSGQLGIESSATSSAATGAPVGATQSSSSFLVETPRSMAQLAAHLDNMRRQGSYNLSHISISYFYYGAMRRNELQNARNALGRNNRGEFAHRNKSFLHNQPISKSYKCGPVIVYDISSLLGGISKPLAESYVFDEDVIAMCRRNAEIAGAANRRDLVQVWLLAELSSEGILNSYLESSRNKQQQLQLNEQSNNTSMMGVFNSMMTQQSVSSSLNSYLDDRPWTMHPFGSKLIQSLIDHYVNNCHDVQTAAMLVWTFSAPKLASSNLQRDAGELGNTSGTAVSGKSRGQHQAELDTTTSSDEWSLVTAEQARSAVIEQSSSGKSWTTADGQPQSLLEHQSTTIETGGHQVSMKQVQRSLINTSSSSQMAPPTGKSSPLGYVGLQQHQQATNRHHNRIHYQAIEQHQQQQSSGRPDCSKFNILSPARSLQNDLILHIYADLLYRLNLLNQRAMILKNIGSNSIYSQLFSSRAGEGDSPVERLDNLIIQCQNDRCREPCRSVQCSSCKSFALFCSICRLPVRGSSSVCIKCLHGGHVNHFDSWFSDYDFCPTGCGCQCLAR